MTHLNFNQLDPAIEAKVEALLDQMTLSEKVGQMIQVHVGRFPKEEVLSRIRTGKVGSVLTIYGADKINELQRTAVTESRLGIPILLGNDVIHGYRTIFPIPLAESCSWNLPLMEQTARIAAEEASADGTDWTFAPMVDVARDARWGRVAEGAGEDTFLGTEIAKARVRGFQSAELESGRKFVSCAKHFAAYGATEDGRDYNTTDMSERVLRDVYLPPFQAAFEEGAGTAMTSFNEIGGVPSTASHFLMTQVLRDEWNFHGMVVSDWNAVGELIPHGVAANLRDAGKLAANAGVDMDMCADAYHIYLEELVMEGKVDAAFIDEATRRILRLKFALGLFDNPYTDESLADSIILRDDFRATALEMAHQSMVLLKNEENVLPLSAETRKIALIGPLADDHHHILGCWYRIGQDDDTESVLDGFRQVLPDAELTHVAGCDLEGKMDSDMAAAVAAAEAADVAVLVLGEGEHMSGEAHSRAHLDLPGEQQALLEAVHATGTPVVLVLMSGRPLVLPWAWQHVPAVLQAWHGGIRTGRAVADLLTGAVNPSGKLTSSWPTTLGQVPIYYNRKNTGRPAEGEGTMQFNKPHWTIYIDAPNEPQFPFGYGLSYSEFAYDHLTVETPVVGLDGTVVVSAEVTNNSAVDGVEIVQLYIRDLVAEVTRPVRELKGFERVALAAGETKTVRFELPVSSLSFVGIDNQFKVEPGDFHVWIGRHAFDGLQGQFTVTA